MYNTQHWLHEGSVRVIAASRGGELACAAARYGRHSVAVRRSVKKGRRGTVRAEAPKVILPQWRAFNSQPAVSPARKSRRRGTARSFTARHVAMRMMPH